MSNSNTARSVLIGAALMMALSMGIRQSLSLFLAPVTHDLAISAAQFTAWFEIGLFRVTRACGNHLLARPDSGLIV